MSYVNQNERPQTNILFLKSAVAGLFNGQEKISIKDRRLYIPLLGCGESGSPLDQGNTITLIVEQFLKFQVNLTESIKMEIVAQKASKIDELVIVIHWKDISKIDWVKLNRSLRVMTQYCRSRETCLKKDRFEF